MTGELGRALEAPTTRQRHMAQAWPAHAPRRLLNALAGSPDTVDHRFLPDPRLASAAGALQSKRAGPSWPTLASCPPSLRPTDTMLAVRASHSSRPAAEGSGFRPAGGARAGASAGACAKAATRLSTGPPCLHGFVCCKASAQGPGSACVQQCSARALVLYSAVSPGRLLRGSPPGGC